jgi:hypothetical protein
VLAEVNLERAGQDRKWGEQNHLDGTGPRTFPLGFGKAAVTFATPAFRVAALAKESTDLRFAIHAGTWADILLEEVFEAMAEVDPAKLRAELVQVAAVAVAWCEAIDRRTPEAGAV